MNTLPVDSAPKIDHPYPPSNAASMLVALLAGALLLSPMVTQAQTLRPFYGDTTEYDIPNFIVDSYLSITDGTNCYEHIGNTATVVGNVLHLTAQLRDIGGGCRAPGTEARVFTGGNISASAALAPGNYIVEYGFSIDNGAWKQVTATTLTVDPAGGKCSRIPAINSIIMDTVSDADSNRFAAVVAKPSIDPILYEQLGKPISAMRYYYIGGLSMTYYPLDDTQVIAHQLRNQAVQLGITNLGENSFMCTLQPPPTALNIVEFYNVTLGHYFLTANVEEAKGIDKGAAGLGWERTGEVISGLNIDVCSANYHLAPVYRFYGTPNVGPNSHFYTANRAECGQVRNDAGWKFEALAFSVYEAVNHACPPESLPVYRLYNNRAAQNDSNHRFTSKLTVVATMRALGWVDEGLVMCIPK